MMSAVLLLNPEGKLSESASTTGNDTGRAGDAKKPVRGRRDEIWVTPDAGILTLELLRTIKAPARRSLVVLGSVGEAQRLLLSTFFEEVIAIAPPIESLEPDEIQEALAAKNSADLFIGGFADERTEQLVLLRGNLKTVIVPFSMFRFTEGTAPPDFSDFQVIDCGLTVRLGEYEAAHDAILYLVDPEFRREEKKRRLEKDQSIGSSIRRLRLQRRMRLFDIKGVSEKEMGRIERGEVQPQPATLEAIAKALGVTKKDLPTF